MSGKVVVNARPGAVQEVLDFAPDDEAPKTIGSAFYRGPDCNFLPYQSDHQSERFAEKFLLRGWTPPSRFIAKGARITAFGSCFAQHITDHFREIGFSISSDQDSEIYVSRIGEGMVNVHALLQQFEWAFEDVRPPENLWHGFKAETFGYDEDVRRRTRDVFLASDVFILTLGLSEVWYDAQTGGVLWRAVPLRHYDEARHRFRVLSFAETKTVLQRILALITQHAPRAAVVLTLSPVPLAATFRPISCLTANAASKALLRGAVDEVLREGGERPAAGVFYFPAYEAVNALFPQPFLEDGRHFHPAIVPAIMRLFEAHYCQTALTVDQAEQSLREARTACVRALADHPLYAAPAAP